jgi:hypothetical protein
MKLELPLGLSEICRFIWRLRETSHNHFQWRINFYFKLVVVVHYKHVEVQRILHLKQILFIPCTEKVVQKKVSLFLSTSVSQCMIYKYIYIYVPYEASCTLCGYVYSQFKTAGVRMHAAKCYSN